MILQKVEVPESVPVHIRQPLGLLTGEAQELHCVFLTFQELYEKSRGNIPLLNQTAPKFFGRIKYILFEHLIIGIARFTDPEIQGKNRNITLRDLFDGTKPPELEELQRKAKNIRTIRKKIVAHLDRDSGLDTTLLPKERIFRDVRESIELIDAIIIIAWKKWTGQEFVMHGSDAPELLSSLKKATLGLVRN